MNIKLLPEFCTIELTTGGYHLGTLAIMEVTKPTCGYGFKQR